MKTNCDKEHRCEGGTAENCDYFDQCILKDSDPSECIDCEFQNCCMSERDGACLYSKAWPEKQPTVKESFTVQK
jgi:hypothetical protein